MLQLKGSIGKPNYQVIALLAAAGVAPLRVFTGLTAQAELLALVDVVADLPLPGCKVQPLGRFSKLRSPGRKMFLFSSVCVCTISEPWSSLVEGD